MLIKNVIKNGLCSGCGTCVALCPNNAITMNLDGKKGIYVPVIDDNLCDNCGTCGKVCPGNGVKFETLNRFIFGREPANKINGNSVNNYVGYASDSYIRHSSTSGGLVTAFLIFALENKLIDGALVTRMKKDNPLEPESFIARTSEEIIQASKSKYCPVPVNTALKEILNSRVEEKFAVVGLPCHIHGIRKAEQINKDLREKIVFHLGIVCNHTPTFLATEFLLKKLGIKKSEVKSLDYRSEGWPGGMKIKTKKGYLYYVLISSSIYWGGVFSLFFYPQRCTVCNDKICALADGSFADAWIPEIIKSDKIGTSLVVSRTVSFDNVLNDMVRHAKINLKEIDENVVQSAQQLIYQKRKVNARIELLEFMGKRIPINTYSYQIKPTIIDYLTSLMFLFRVNTLSKRRFWILIDIHQFFLKRIQWFVLSAKRIIKSFLH